jgi:hypothetical protein
MNPFGPVSFVIVCLASLAAFAARLEAGVINPDISVIGQPFIHYTGDPADPDRKKLRLDVGETEFVFDAALNPYARGTFVAALSEEEGIELEEGYFNLFKGLPFELALKGGKYRVGFGPLNPVHPHAYPFAERPHVLAEYLPGEESFNETGLSLSRRFPIAGDFSINASADWLQGNTFHAAEEGAEEPDPNADLTRPAFLGRLSGFSLIGEQSALEFGVSGTEGTNDVSAGTRTRTWGADAKVKAWISPQAYLIVQGEGLRSEPEEIDPESGDVTSTSYMGGYLFADYNFAIRYNVGASYEHYQQRDEDKSTAQVFGVFAGYSLLEETTAFRLDWNHFKPEGGDGVSSVTLRVLYSMGPHKAHQF